MNYIPQEIIIAGRSLPLILLFILSGFFSCIFVVWRESCKDGFNINKIFDLTFVYTILSGAITYFLYRYYEWNSLYKPGNWILDFDLRTLSLFISQIILLLLALYYSKKNSWSVYRLLDILAVGFSFFIFCVSIGIFAIYGFRSYLILALLITGVYFVILRFRGYRFKSGYIYSSYLVFLSMIYLLLFKEPGYLLFSAVFFTIGVVNFFLRRKIIMDRVPLTREFIDKIKSLLTSREKKLHQEELLLQSEDPYLKEGRATDNAEMMDEAILEDRAKEELDNRLNLIKMLRTQINKALAAIHIGTYGKCEICGNDIDKARLKVFPEATQCLECAKRIESRG